MMIRSWFALAACLVVTVAMCQTKPASGKTEPAANPPNIAFEKMKTLVGDWERVNGKIQLKNSFRLIGDGSALLHIETPEGEQEIVTIFYPVGPDVYADHYCYLKNQPRFVAKPSADPSVIKFEFRGITNLHAQTGDEHMHGTTWRLIDNNHLVQEWHLWKDGKQAKLVRLEFVRR